MIVGACGNILIGRDSRYIIKNPSWSGPWRTFEDRVVGGASALERGLKDRRCPIRLFGSGWGASVSLDGIMDRGAWRALKSCRKVPIVDKANIYKRVSMNSIPRTVFLTSFFNTYFLRGTQRNPP